MSKKTIEPLASRAMEHGKKAFGAKYVRPGFARTPELDLAFALGRGSPVFEPVTLLPDLVPGKKLPNSYTTIHRNVALAALRETELEANPKPLDETEATKLIIASVKSSLPPKGTALRAAEAMVGPSCVLPAYLSGLEKAGSQQWNNGSWGSHFGVVHGLLLRVPPAETKAARARLTTLYKAHKNDALDILLHGKEGIERSGYKYSTLYKSYQRSKGFSDPATVHQLMFIDDDPAFVAQQFEALWTAFKWKTVGRMIGAAPARLFFVGGDATLATELRAMAGYPGTQELEAFAAYADLHPSRVTEHMKVLVNSGGKAAKLAQAWLETN